MSIDWQKKAREVLAIEIDGLKNISQNIGESFGQAVELLSSCKGRVVVTGIGKSGLVGRKMAATFTSTGTPAFFLHPAEGAHGDLGSVQSADLIIAISYSGNTVELNAILPALKSLGLPIIALTSGAHSALARIADITLNCTVPREACPNNLAPTASTTATLAMGDALAMCLIEAKSFTASDFKRFHPGGSLGQRLLLSVKDLMHTEKVPVVDLEASLGDALRVQDEGGLGAVLIAGKGKGLAGILTDGDVRNLAFLDKADKGAAVKDLMTKNPLSVKAEHSAAEVLDLMESKEITVLPVLNDTGCVIGVVHLHDLLGKGQISFGGK